MTPDTLKYRFRQSFTGKWILQVNKNISHDRDIGGMIDTISIPTWVDLDATDAIIVSLLLNRD